MLYDYFMWIDCSIHSRACAWSTVQFLLFEECCSCYIINAAINSQEIIILHPRKWWKNRHMLSFIYNFWFLGSLQQNLLETWFFLQMITDDYHTLSHNIRKLLCLGVKITVNIMLIFLGYICCLELVCNFSISLFMLCQILFFFSWGKKLRL